MSRISDSLDPNGIGILILQHEAYDAKDFSLDLRGAIRAVRVYDRDDNTGGIGSWKYDKDSAGDLIGGQVWYRASRAISMWRFATPVMSQKPKGGGTPTPSKSGSICPVLPDKGATSLLPIFDDDYNADGRVVPRLAKRPKTWPKFPVGMVGISLTADIEREQQDLFLPCDPNLYAVHYGDPKCGTLVADLTGESEVEPKRLARLQSMMRVVKGPTGCISYFGENSIAWTINSSRCKDVRGGLMYDAEAPCGGRKEKSEEESSKELEEAIENLTFQFNNSPNNMSGRGGAVGASNEYWKRIANQIALREFDRLQKEKEAEQRGERTGSTVAEDPGPVHAHASQGQSGIIEVGDGDDKHKIGSDADGIAINASHISTNAYFKERCSKRDGPFLFEGQYIPPCHRPHLVFTYLRWDPSVTHPFVCGSRDGKWRWESECLGYTMPTLDGVPPPPPPPPPPPGLPPNVPTQLGFGSGTGLTIGTNGTVVSDSPWTAQSWIPGLRIEGYAAMTNQVAVPALLFRPQNLQVGSEDLRLSSNHTIAGFVDHDDHAPMTLRIEAFAAKQDAGWDYTYAPLAGRWRGGSSDGGIMFLPPEVSIDDVTNDFVPVVISRSTAYMIAGPQAFFGAGGLDITNAVPKGVSWGAAQTGIGIEAGATQVNDLVFFTHDGTNGVARPAFAFARNTGTVPEAFMWKSGSTSSWGALRHNNTANREYRYVDVTSYVGSVSAGVANGLMTQGSIPYAAADGTMTQTNASLFYQAANTNLGLMTTSQFGSGVGVIGLGNATTNPTANPTNAVVLYASGGAGVGRGSGGTVTTFAPSGPHCGACGADFWTVAAKNEAWGAYIYECGWCGARYKKGPKSFLDKLTAEQKAELIRE